MEIDDVEHNKAVCQWLTDCSHAVPGSESSATPRADNRYAQFRVYLGSLHMQMKKKEISSSK